MKGFTDLLLMEQNSDWKYKYSDSLKQKIAYNPKTGVIVTEDGVEYSSQENAILRKKASPTPLCVHLIKKVFKGLIIE